MSHTQTRSDRDKFIRVKWENISEGSEAFFGVRQENAFDGPSYDYESIMHSSWKMKSESGNLTLETIQEDRQKSIGQHVALSRLDAEQLKYIYCNRTSQIQNSTDKYCTSSKFGKNVSIPLNQTYDMIEKKTFTGLNETVEQTKVYQCLEVASGFYFPVIKGCRAYNGDLAASNGEWDDEKMWTWKCKVDHVLNKATVLSTACLIKGPGNETNVVLGQNCVAKTDKCVYSCYPLFKWRYYCNHSAADQEANYQGHKTGKDMRDCPPSFV